MEGHELDLPLGQETYSFGLSLATGKIFKSIIKVGCIFPMVISYELRMEQNRDDHRENAPHFEEGARDDIIIWVPEI